MAGVADPLVPEKSESEKQDVKAVSSAEKTSLPYVSSRGSVRKQGTNNPNELVTAGDYAKAVDQWLWQCYYWQSVAIGFSYFLTQVVHQSSRKNTNVNNVQQTVVTAVPTPSISDGREFLIPPLWKRFSAEFLDFSILFLLKLIVTFIAIDFFELIDLEKYDFDIIKAEGFLLDYRLAFEMTSEIVMLEIIHRFVVCFFEALCLHRGTLSPGGATPGKSILGLKVISCTTIQDLGQGKIFVRPAKDIGFGWALLRSFVKNFSLAFFFPICFTLLMFQHNRSAYDILCNCVVVEELYINRLRTN